MWRELVRTNPIPADSSGVDRGDYAGHFYLRGDLEKEEMKIEIEADYDTSVKYKGQHREIHYIISAHAFRDNTKTGFYDMPMTWCTYILLDEGMHEKFKSKIDKAPWNGGQTFYRKITEEHIDCSPELKAKWDQPHYKIGDDFANLWDVENRRFEMYNREYMERHIKRVINYLHDGVTEE